MDWVQSFFTSNSLVWGMREGGGVFFTHLNFFRTRFSAATHSAAVCTSVGAYIYIYSAYPYSVINYIIYRGGNFFLFSYASKLAHLSTRGGIWQISIYRTVRFSRSDEHYIMHFRRIQYYYYYYVHARALLLLTL